MRQTTHLALRRQPLRTFSAMVFASALALSSCADGIAPQDPEGSGPETPPPETITATESPPVDTNGEDTGAGNGGPEVSGEVPNIDTVSNDSATYPMGDPDTAPKEYQGADWAGLDVTGIRLATHENFDRVVFDLTGAGTPGWFVDYTANPVQQGSGFPFDFDGTTALTVNLLGLAQPLEVDVVAGTGGVVNEVVPGINHHGTSRFFIGMDDVLPYSVQLLEEPKRVVIDILHEPAAAVTPIGHADTEPKARESGLPHQRMVSDVRLAAHDGFDRVVFDTVGEGTTGWFTGYTAYPVELASGLPVEYDGSMALEVNLTGMVPWTDEGREQPDLGTTPGAGGPVTEVVSTVTWHGTSQFIIGLNDRLPHSIEVIEEPQRVVVDILHG